MWGGGATTKGFFYVLLMGLMSKRACMCGGVAGVSRRACVMCVCWLLGKRGDGVPHTHAHTENPYGPPLPHAPGLPILGFRV